MYRDRLEIYHALEKEFNSKILVYVTSDRPNMGAQISPDVIDYFIDHLDKIGPCEKISLFLYTRGGDTSAARNIVNLLRMYCDNLQVIVPHKAHSSGTIISLGANEIVMTKQATLGPIDPSLHTALNPRLPDGGIFPVSVEAVKGYLEFAKNELKIEDEAVLGDIFQKLSDFVHPLVLGEVYRSKAQIQMMAAKCRMYLALLNFYKIFYQKSQLILRLLPSKAKAF
jgi:ClpP class serine protease